LRYDGALNHRWEGHPMPARIHGLAAVAIAAGLTAGMGSAFAAGKLAPADIKTAFFTGQPFTASTPSGVKYKMTYTEDGKVAREPVGRAGGKGEGTWALSKDGFCTTWKGSKPNCYALVSSGDNKWSVMKGSGLMAVWTK
jgi:hypothetical protein